MQALSQVGRCCTFDATGDGYGRGEGFVMMLLYPSKRLSNEKKLPLSFISGSAVNQVDSNSYLHAIVIDYVLERACFLARKIVASIK